MNNCDERRILIVEDDPLIARAWTIGLAQSGYQVFHAPSAAAAISLYNERNFDAAIIDVNLPDQSGIAVLKAFRAKDKQLKIIVVTARQDEEIAVEALDRGTTEFVRKPVGPKELATRLDRILNFTNETTQQITPVEDFVINTSAGEIFLHGKVMKLSVSEFQILSRLIRQLGHPVTRLQLLDGLGIEEQISDRAIDSHMSRIRRKLKTSQLKNPPPVYAINSVWGSGYALEKVRAK